MRYVINASAITVFFLTFILLNSNPAKADSALEQYFGGSSIYFELSQDEITDTDKFEGEADLRFRSDDLKVFLRASNNMPFPHQTDNFEFQKRGFEYDINRDWTVYGGNFSMIVGRGAALHAVEDRGVGWDAQLDGGKFEGEIGFLSLTGFWGENKSDNTLYYTTGVNTPENVRADKLYGGVVGLDFNDVDFRIGLVKTDMMRNAAQVSVTITEADVNWKAGDFNIYFEGDWYKTETQGAEEPVEGRAQLAEINWANPGISISGQYIDYENSLFEYGTHPTLKRTEVDESTANPVDQEGFRIDTNITPGSWDGATLRVILVNLKADLTEGAGHRDFFVEYASSPLQDYSFIASVERIGGQLLYYGGVPGNEENYKLSVDGPFFLGGSFHAQTRIRQLSNDIESDDELELGFDWTVSPEFTIGLFRETSTNPIEPPPPGLFGIPIDSPGQWNHMFVNYTPDPWSEWNLLIGSRRGGYQCSGGVCANLPPFKGIQLTYSRLL
jgi:hypothetical protein